MPDLTGKKLDEASLLLSEIGMYIESVEYEPNDAEPGTIIWQSVPNGSEILPGEETIDVRISGVSGETMLPMPELSDYDSLEEIAAVLAAYGISDYCFRLRRITAIQTQTPLRFNRQTCWPRHRTRMRGSRFTRVGSC